MRADSCQAIPTEKPGKPRVNISHGSKIRVVV
jgi:hypothetical protein